MRMFQILIGAIIVLSSLGIVTVSFPASRNQGNVNYGEVVMENGILYTSHSPIRINSDAEFTSQNGVVNGSGTESDPYIISGWKIDAHGGGDAIYIGNTTKYFVVENCYLYNASYHSWSYFPGAGIILYNVQNSTIYNNTALGNYAGIWLDSSRYNNIYNNTVSNNRDGIDLWDSSNYNIIFNNTVSNNYYGISLWFSTNEELINNTMENDGIFIEGDSVEYWNTHTIDTTNTVNGKPVYYWKNRTGGTVPLSAGEVILANCTEVTVENQNVCDATVGIELGFSNSNDITNNTLMNNDEGIYLDFCWYNILLNNTIYNSSWRVGINIEYSGYNRLYGNKLENNGISLYGDKGTWTTEDIPMNNTVNRKPVYYYKNVDMDNDTVPQNAGQIIMGNVSHLYVENLNIQNTSAPIELGFSSHIYISNNNVKGFEIDSSNNNIISNNTVHGWWGIVLIFSTINTISDNTIYENDVGIDVIFSDQNTISDNTIYYNRKGISIDYSDKNTIRGNKIENNTYYGIEINWGSNNIIYQNYFYYNHNSESTYNSSHVQAYDRGSNNCWNSSQYGNYWLDWAENNDTNDQNPQDGIVDWPYRIGGSAGAKDYYPLKYTIPSPPQNLQARTGDGYVNLTWDAPSDNGGSPITEYRIYRDGVQIDTVPANQLWYNDTNVVNGNTYTYYITAVNSVGESDKSNEVQATPSGSVPEFSAMEIIVMLVAVAMLAAVRRR